MLQIFNRLPLFIFIFIITSCEKPLHELRNLPPDYHSEKKFSGSLQSVARCMGEKIEKKEGSLIFGYPMIQKETISENEIDIINREARSGLVLYVINLKRENSILEYSVSPMNGTPLLHPHERHQKYQSIFDQCT